MSVGLDIGSKSIKVVELKMESGKPTLKAAGIIGVRDVSVEHLQNDQEITTLADTIKKLITSAKISTKDIVLSLPETQVFTRNIRLPLLTDQEIASAIKWQAEDIIPIPLKEAIFQHIILERKENTQPPSVSVLVVAAPRILVEKYTKVISRAGFTTVGVETELLALSRVYSSPQTAVLIDFGSKSTDIAITKDGKLLFTRSIPTAGDAITRAVAQSLNVTVEQAEEYKKTYGLNQSQVEGKIANAVMPIFKVIVEEVKKAIHFYQTEEKEDTPNQIILTGGSAGLPQVTATFANLTGLEVNVGNPFNKIVVRPEVMKNLENYAPLYSVAVGLALKE